MVDLAELHVRQGRYTPLVNYKGKGWVVWALHCYGQGAVKTMNEIVDDLTTTTENSTKE